MKKHPMIKLILCTLFGFFPIYGLQTSDLMSYETYASVKWSIPYVYTLSKEGQSLVYFGANHSCNPKDKQYPLLEEQWNEFLEKTKGQNCIVLVEGCLRGARSSKEEAIKQGSEGSYITILASEKGVSIMCPEPSDTVLDKHLKKQFSDEEIKYKEFAQCCRQFHRCKEDDSNLVFEQYYKKFKEDKFPSLEQAGRIHKKLFKTNLDINDEPFFYHITNPVETGTIINTLCRQASIKRDMCIIAAIKELIAQKKNIFIVYGATHAIMQEAAVRSAWITE